ncbi:tRNA1(Val) (adenine(37)-N6)-methyltransferase [Acidaminobacter sp. JC074]|uniref:tRNA1(Val) (adenine(37)-N6)-methyltransferase n=1 Tax=Acidaminobacter sp. JC074 TaxID=2530199 RepID=UPI001F0FD06B|nr:tRNA1(Val) (adenine(37)-N6)-methyltransferase [Acidaminobacter sp. JC074]MCH4887371.1 tRNA1(Val) (adenine(37)-N6)-methyltransferase [Acidaminobacter sp. JC074]
MLDNERFDLIQKNGFGIIQNKKWFSYGIDAVLLSHFAEIKDGDRIMDMGTGTGIIPLLLSLNHQVDKIYGIEKQDQVADMAHRSVKKNKLEDTIEIIKADVLELKNKFDAGSFDVIVSNPPYFKKGNALINNGSVKAQSRHETSGDLEDFIKTAALLLKNKGCFYMVHRPMRLVDIIYYCRKHNLEPKTLQYVYPHCDKPPNILLIKCVKNGNHELKHKENLYVYDNNRDYTPQIREIYRNLKIDVF